MEKVAEIVRGHHENFDGTGYPDGLAGHAIPIGARITTVTDCFEAMVSPRVYSTGRSVDEALSELKRCSGKQFDPEIVEIFLHKFETHQITYSPPILVKTEAEVCNNPVLPLVAS